MTIKRTIMLLAAVSVIAAACTVSESETGTQLDRPAAEGVTVSFEQPVVDGSLVTKALDEDHRFYFEENAQINVYSRKARECMTYTLSTSSDSWFAEFFVEGFNLKDDEYGAVYPYSRPAPDPTGITFSLAGQNQDENDDATGTSAYDLNYANAYIRENRGSFNFKHKVTWLRIHAFPYSTTTFKTITVTADEGIANTMTLDAVSGDVTAVPASTDEAMVLTLNNGDGIEVEGRGSLVAYVTLPQGVYTNLHIVCGDYDKTIAGETALAAGVVYPVTMMTKLSKPEASLKSGSVKRGTGVALTSFERGDIYYTLDGTTPTSESEMYDGRDVVITESCTLKAVAVKSGWYDSDVLTVNYTIASAPKPTVSVTGEGEVTITSEEENAVFRYTIDNSDPNTSSTVLEYDPADKPVVGENTIIKAIAFSPFYEGGEITTYYHLPVDVLDAGFFTTYQMYPRWKTACAGFMVQGSYDETTKGYVLHEKDYILGNGLSSDIKIRWISIETNERTSARINLFSAEVLSTLNILNGTDYIELVTSPSANKVRIDFPEEEQFNSWGISVGNYTAAINIKEINIGYTDFVKE